MSYQWPADSNLRPKNTGKSEKGVNLTPGSVLELNFAHMSTVTLSGDPCATVSVFLRFRLDHGFNMSYQWPSESVLRLKNQKRCEFAFSWPTAACTNPDDSFSAENMRMEMGLWGGGIAPHWPTTVLR